MNATSNIDRASVSPTMQRLLDYMGKHGNEIHRHPGGFWAHKDWKPHSGEWFGTKSVQAVVNRGLAVYGEYHDGRGGRFPIAARIA